MPTVQRSCVPLDGTETGEEAALGDNVISPVTCDVTPDVTLSSGFSLRVALVSQPPLLGVVCCFVWAGLFQDVAVGLQPGHIHVR